MYKLYQTESKQESRDVLQFWKQIFS